MSYTWLNSEKAPKILVAARKQIGVTEFIGNSNNPKIIEWAMLTNLNAYYTNDSIPWCGLFIAYCCHSKGLPIVKQPLWALSWAKWGIASDVPMLGDVLTFKRTGGGHVGIYVGEDESCFHVLGGNQGDMVCISRVLKSRLYASRRTDWRVAQPINVRQVWLSPKGVVSENEQ